MTDLPYTNTLWNHITEIHHDIYIYIHKGRYIMADIYYNSRDIMADIFRLIYIYIYITADILRQIYCSRYILECGRYIMADILWR